jgi:hypothetical protein
MHMHIPDPTTTTAVAQVCNEAAFDAGDEGCFRVYHKVPTSNATEDTCASFNTTTLTPIYFKENVATGEILTGVDFTTYTVSGLTETSELTMTCTGAAGMINAKLSASDTNIGPVFGRADGFTLGQCSMLKLGGAGSTLVTLLVQGSTDACPQVTITTADPEDDYPSDAFTTGISATSALLLGVAMSL